MGLVSAAKAVEGEVVAAAVAVGAAATQAVQAVIGDLKAQTAVPAPAEAAIVAVPVVAAATITAGPVQLPTTGAAPEVVAAAVVEPAVVAAPDAAVVAATPLTKTQQLQAKIDALNKTIESHTAKVAQLTGLLRSADLLDGIKAGSVIVAKVGRADTAKEVTATVVGVQVLADGDKRFKIYYGEGFDADTVVIQESQIVDVKQV